MRRRWIWAGLAGLAALVLLAAAAFPYLFAEVWMVAGRHHIALAPPPIGDFAARPGPPAGELVDGYWRIQDLGQNTWAIGEPGDDPDNYEYLILGQDRALLIDSGMGSRDIRPAIARITHKPYTVIPTHLHYDHTNGLRWVATRGRAPTGQGSVALIDLPATRALVRDDLVHLRRYQFLASPDGAPPPVFHVSEWVKPGGLIDLGGRQVRVLFTPGHTATSVSIYDSAAGRLFTGDLIYPTTLYEFVPDSSLSAWAATAESLLKTVPPDTVIYGAHCCRNDVPAQAPYLAIGDLADARQAILGIQSGKVHGRGLILRRFPVNSRMTLITLYPLANR